MFPHCRSSSRTEHLDSRHEDPSSLSVTTFQQNKQTWTKDDTKEHLREQTNSSKMERKPEGSIATRVTRTARRLQHFNTKRPSTLL